MTLVPFRPHVFAYKVLDTDTPDTLNALVDQVPHAPIPQPLFAAANDGSGAAIGLWDGMIYYNKVAVGSYVVATTPGSFPVIWDGPTFEGWFASS